MTPKRLQILRLIHGYWHHYQMGPTLQELANQMNVKSRSNMHYAIAALIKQGWLARISNESRGIALTRRGLALCKGNMYVHGAPPPTPENMTVPVNAKNEVLEVQKQA
jgi:SOS-response transcriptional repressor LexA